MTSKLLREPKRQKRLDARIDNWTEVRKLMNNSRFQQGYKRPGSYKK